MVVTESNKLIICGSFAECYTRQKGYLPSAMKNTLVKSDTWQKYVHSGTKIAFLLSVYAVTLDKEANICMLLASCPTLGKEGRFAECPVFDTRQRRKVCRVPVI